MGAVSKFRKFWKTLTPIEQSNLWDILCMVRGPDNANTHAKSAATARIRGLLLNSKVWFSGCSVRDFKDPAILFKGDLYTFAGSHYQAHYMLAVQAMRSEGY
jgi:hypothetical protein